MRARTLMVQGTGSGVGKSFLVTGLCRLFAQAGLRVAPFKAQNMSLNAWVAADGGEMARAQAVQAEAAGVEPRVEMNPILLKPKGDGVSQVILRGRPLGDLGAGALWAEGERLWAAVAEALDRLREAFDLVVIEGAGSPAELNLRRHDLANMRVAGAAGAPVLLVGDIERGGIFAALLGTLDLLPPEERRRVRGLVVNKFRGDLRLFEDGVRILEERGGVPVVGVLPRLEVEIEPEDALDLGGRAAWTAPAAEPGTLEIAVVLHPHLSNFSDLEPLRRRPGVRLRPVRRPEELGEPDAILLPGSKNTVDDLRAHRESGPRPPGRDPPARYGRLSFRR
ncbi:MAG: cobyric acid synthase [Bacillota bacterium]|nr:cobyric acid synthase [Bacillota bacterium]